MTIPERSTSSSMSRSLLKKSSSRLGWGVMPRPIYEMLLKKRVKRWGWLSKKLVIVVFEDGKMGIINVEKGTYRAVRA